MYDEDLFVLFIPVMRTTLSNQNHIIMNPINNPVIIINSPTPVTSKITNEWFRLTNTAVSIAVNIFQ